MLIGLFFLNCSSVLFIFLFYLCKFFQILIYISGHTFRPLLFIFHKLIIHIIEFREFLKQGHKLLIGAVLLYLFTIFLIQVTGIENQFGKVAPSPCSHHLGKWVDEYETAITVVDQLYESSVHHLVAHRLIGEQGGLVGIQLTHIVGIQFT